MSKFNEKVIKALETGEYICNECGAKMQFENEYEDTLVCLNCGYSIDYDLYGFEDEDFETLYPSEEEVLGHQLEPDKDDDNPEGETYDEVCGELSRAD